MTVLDCLHKIREEQDPSLAFRFSCRMGVCGSCAMLINGKPTLACNTQALDLTDTALTVAPLPNFNIIRDLVPDLAPMFEAHRQAKPYIIRKDAEEVARPSGEYFQNPHQLEAFLQFTYCIKCGICMAACPTMATDRRCFGPMPLAQVYRYNTDSRDEGGEERKDLVAKSHGVFGCHFAGECSNACPKGVDPARAIQLLKRDLVRDYLNLKKAQASAEVHSLSPDAQRKPKIEAPPYTAGLP
jgi:succinate dehydrogenase / fumarate reductase iron-sulfur subunit